MKRNTGDRIREEEYRRQNTRRRIQETEYRRQNGKRKKFRAWIPAFAGMTARKLPVGTPAVTASC